MMFQLAVAEPFPLSAPFRPEDYGWEVSNPMVPQQQLQAAMQELHRYGYVSTQYKRWQIPFAFPAVLTVAGYDPGRRMYRLFYMPPFECPDEEITREEILREIRYGTGWWRDSPDRPSVSLPVK